MSPKTCCIAPSIGTTVNANGKLTPCCEWDAKPVVPYAEFDKWINSDHIRDVRKKHYNGERVSACKQCYANEQVGKESLRKTFNIEFSKYTNLKTLDTENWIVDSEDVTTLDLKLGNLCDLKCIMCNGNSSSQLMTEVKLNKNQFVKLENFTEPQYEVDFKWPLDIKFKEFLLRFKHNLRWIKFTGGEPTLIPYVLNFINEIIDPAQVTLSIVTNGNTYNKQFFDALVKFHCVWVSTSLEGIGIDNDLLRYNSNWDDIEQNVLRYIKMPNCYVNINHVLQATSVYTLLPLLNWCEQYQIKLTPLRLTDPVYLQINGVKDISVFVKQLESFKSTVNNDVIKNILRMLSSHKYDSHLEKQRLEYFTLLDSIRNTTLVNRYH